LNRGLDDLLGVVGCFEIPCGGLMKIAPLVVVALVASATPALAQEQEVVLAAPAFEQQLDELAKWLNEYEAWEKWFELWGNRIAHNFDDQPIWERKKRPEPPPWLAVECHDNLVADGQLASACYLLRHWDEQPLLILQRRASSLTRSGGTVDDKVVKQSFFRRVHLTGLWMEARYPATPAYGIIGMQVGVVEAGRFTLPAVGMMLVMVPDGAGGHALRPASTLGFGYLLGNFVPPFMKRQVSLHLNLVRTHVHGGEQILPGTTNVHLFGLSVSPRRRR
jgi:hypothetical protein